MNKTKQSLTLRRRGEFTIEALGDNHCGVNDFQNIRYEVEVICSTRLDSRGFLFEQRNVDAFFQTIRSTSASCEALTKECAKKLRNLILDENPACEVKSIAVNLCPAPYAADMTFTWKF